MELTEKAKKDILDCVLNTIGSISDKEYQKRVWIRAEGPEWDDFDETTCIFFDVGDPMIKNYKDYGITESQYQILKKFRDEFSAFCDGPGLIYYQPQEFIDKPEWTKIVEMAKDVLRSFNYKKMSLSERRGDF